MCKIYLVCRTCRYSEIHRLYRTKPQCYIQWVYKAPLCITLRIKSWVVAYLKFIFIFLRKKKKINFILCNFLVRTLQYLKEEFEFVFKKLKKPPSKVAQKNQHPLFSLLPWAAQTAQTEEFMFQNSKIRLIEQLYIELGTKP